MDKNGIGFVVLAVGLVLGVFWFAGVDQTRLAAARVDVAARLERQPEAVEAAANVGMTLAAKVVAGALASLVLAGLVIVWQAARIRGLREGGRAMTPETTVQTYFVDKSLLTGAQAAGPQVSEAERALMERLMREAEGRVDMTLMMSWGMSEREVRRLREDWQRRGLAEKRADRNNAVFLVQTSGMSEPVQAASERPDGRDS